MGCIVWPDTITAIPQTRQNSPNFVFLALCGSLGLVLLELAEIAFLGNWGIEEGRVCALFVCGNLRGGVGANRARHAWTRRSFLPAWSGADSPRSPRRFSGWPCKCRMPRLAGTPALKWRVQSTAGTPPPS